MYKLLGHEVEPVEIPEFDEDDNDIEDAINDMVEKQNTNTILISVAIGVGCLLTIVVVVLCCQCRAKIVFAVTAAKRIVGSQ